jgi:hypothetical protein
MSDEKKTRFEEAGERPAGGLAGEFLSMLKHNKKYWLVPLLLLLLGLGVLIIAGGSAAAPFIYTLF